MTIAIDFGTSNTVITRWNPVTEQPETITIPSISQIGGINPPLIPSLVYVEEGKLGQVIIGEQVRSQGLDIKNDPRFFKSFKRGIGTEIQGFLPELDGTNITFEQIGQWYIKSIINSLASVLPDTGESLILTVPVDSFEAYRRWLTKVCVDLPVNQVQMIDEPTAAALGYGVNQGSLLLVVDFGGGTLDLSLVQLTKGGENNSTPLGYILKWGQKPLEKSAQKVKTARVIGKAGKNLGGTDIDNWIADYWLKNNQVKLNSLITRLAEKVKINLSHQETATEVYFDDVEFESYELSLSRSELGSILTEHKFTEQLDDLMTQVLQQGRRNGIETNDIDVVLLVGGTAQMPAVQTWIENYFDSGKIRKSKPFEAIAHGALQLTQGLELTDFLYHSYGIRYWDRKNQTHNWHPIIKAGQPYPMNNPVELFLGASVENQPSIELIIAELGGDSGGTEIYFDGSRLITRSISTQNINVKPLNENASTIARLDPLGFPGSDRIKVQFIVDQSRSLRITVEDLLINQTILDNQVVVELN